MRCSICDFNKEAPSEYFEGLQFRYSKYTRLKVDTKTGDIICSMCASSVREVLMEQEFDDDSMGWHSSSLPVR